MTRITEEWKPVVGYEGWYQVSNLARIMRIKGGCGAVPGRILRPATKPNGYQKVVLSTECNPATHYVHEIVAHAFLGSRPAGMEINHKDTNKTNNVADNLEYRTPLGNKLHAVSFGLVGGNYGSYKLSDDEIRDIRRLSGSYSRAELGRRYGVHPSCITRIVLGQAYRHVA